MSLIRTVTEAGRIDGQKLPVILPAFRKEINEPESAFSECADSETRGRELTASRIPLLLIAFPPFVLAYEKFFRKATGLFHKEAKKGAAAFSTEQKE